LSDFSVTGVKGAVVDRRIESSRTVSRSALLALTTCALGIALVASGVAAASPKRTVAQKTITLFSLPTHEAFVANADDELRGDVSNPFGTHISRAASGLSNLDEKNGPFPGDEALFSFNVYTTSSLNVSAGSAVFTCQYYFDKNAFCDVSFQLNGGTLLGAGAFNFNASKFAIAITGGYGKYSGASGDVEATPSGKLAQRLAFVLTH
jgi:hypothetical protein